MGIQAAAAFGGATTGAILGAIDGGLGGALKGAGIGFVMGATLGTGVDIWGAPFALAAAAGGAAVAGVSGGLEGLGDFAAGAAGASMGYTIGSALAPQRAYAQTETQSALSESEQRQIKQQLSAGQLESPTGITKRSAPTVVRKAEEAKITSNLAEKGAVGIGNNPSVENNATETKSIFTLVGRRENAFVYDWEGVGIENLSVKFQWRGADVFSVDMNVEKFAQYGIKIGPFDIPITPWIPMAEIDRTLPWYYPAIYNNKSKYK